MPAASHADSFRLFLALWPAPGVRAALETQAAAWQWPAQARRTRAARLHLTLHFLGGVEAGRVGALRARLAQVRWGGSELVLDRCAVWAGGIAVLEATEVPPALCALHADLAAALRALDLRVDTRRWRPHVTLARQAQGAKAPAAFAPVRWKAGSAFALVRTLPGGAYVQLQCFG